MRILLAGLAAAAVFGAAAIALLVLLEGPSPAGAARSTAGEGGPGPAQEPGPITLPPPQATPAALATEAIPAPPVRPAIRGARVGRVASPWEDVPVASRESQLGPVAPFVRAALAAARDQMDPCFDDEAAREAQRSAGPARAGAEPVRGPGVLVLRLESRQDGLDVVGADVESYGTSSRELAQCAGHVLAGWPVEATGATPGMRYRLKFPLQ